MLLVLYAALAFQSGEKDQLRYPEYFPKPAYDFEQNPLSADKVTLGKLLFYDPRLSKDNSISCASCHSPYNAFAHTDHDLSHGIDDRIGTRNAPALFNLAWQKSFMWDGAIHHLDMQALAPISHPDEMGEDLKSVVFKLQESALYPQAFERAWKDSIVTGERILKSLAQFQLTLVSASAKYDQVKLGQAEFTEKEKNGYRLFKQNCSNCHTEPLFTNQGFASNGLPIDSSLEDYGRVMITKKPQDSFLFKIPSLRNLKYSYPYMHDGRFDKLRQVINHYNTLAFVPDSEEKSKAIPINLTSHEKTDLIAFLLTLSDEQFVFDPSNKFPKELLIVNKNNK